MHKIRPSSASLTNTEKEYFISTTKGFGGTETTSVPGRQLRPVCLSLESEGFQKERMKGCRKRRRS